MKEAILSWLGAGCNIDDGVGLLETYSQNSLLVRMVRTNPSRSLKLIIRELSRLAGISASDVTHPAAESSSQSKTANFRNEFPFLQYPACPLELKALVTDKFSSFYRYRDLHAQLFDCTNVQECADTARTLIENYQENRLIYAELDYYKEHKTVLGKHPIFRHFNKMKNLRKLNIKDLVRKQLQLEHNIWRIESELKKKDKPHLEAERRRRLEEKKAELAEVERLLS